jgi:hypothetical protein
LNQNKLQPLLIGGLLGGFALAQLAFFDHPYIWDGLYYIAGSARDLYLHPGKLIPDGPWDNGHPALFFWTLAAAWLALGPHLWVSHSIMLGFGLATLYLTWKVGKALFGPRVALLGTLVLAVHPLFYYQTGTLSLDIPVAACCLAIFLSCRRHRWGLAILVGSAMVLTRETALIFLPAVVGAAWLLPEDESESTGLKGPLAVLVVPGLVLAAWYIFHHEVVGWWLYSDKSRDVKLTLRSLIWPFPYELYQRTLRPFLRFHGQAFATMLIVAALVFEWVRRIRVKGEKLTREAWVLALASAGIILPMGLIITIMSFYLPRYFVPVLPFYCLLAGWAAGRTKFLAPLVTGGIIVFLLMAHEGTALPGYEDNRGTERFMILNQKGAGFVEANYPDATVYTRWPIWQALCDPIYGYVKKPISVVVIGNKPWFTEYCAPGRYRYISRHEQPRFGADDFDLLWVSRDDLNSGDYDWLRKQVDLVPAGSVTHEQLEILFFVPGPLAEDGEAEPVVEAPPGPEEGV